MKPFKVLVVEDHDELRMASLRALRKRGFVCDSAEDGLRGTDKLFNGAYDVLLTDLAMPEMNGHALCVQALRMRDRPAVVVLTGVVEERISADLKKRGVDRILYKPMGFSELAAAVREAAERRAGAAPDALPRVDASPPRPAAQEEDAAKGSEGACDAENRPHAQRRFGPPLSESEPVEVAILMREREAAARMREAFAERELRAACFDGADALHRFLTSSDPDLVILDQQLDGFLSGSAIAQQLIERFLGPKIVLLEPGDRQGAGEENDAVSSSPSQIWRLSDDTPYERVAARAAAFLRNANGGYATISPAAHAIAASSPTAPPSPDLLKRLARHLQKSPEQIDADQVAADISSDPPAATELLRLVNSAHVGLRRRVNRIADAVKLLGASRSVSLTYAVCQKKLVVKLDAPWADELHRWYHRRSLLIGCAARELLRRDFPLLAEDGFALGLLQELGIVLIAGTHGERYAQRIRSGASQPRTADLTAMERHAVKVDHASVSAAALERWGFPRPVVQLVLCHHNAEIAGPSTAPEDRLHAAMRVGEALADLLDDRGVARRTHFAQMLKDSGLAPDEHPRDLLAATAAAAEEYLSILSLPSPEDGAVEETIEALSRDDSAGDASAGGRAGSASTTHGGARGPREDASERRDARPVSRTPLRDSLRKLVGV
ncbi:HDOD domain-containing protein [Alienimonas sp. DA493]|uniref:HDOD domain-containing protein n=1 Tax=Alienimonas sp. DA493 TaxID=3373605 RepID=UPI00375492BC